MGLAEPLPATMTLGGMASMSKSHSSANMCCNREIERAKHQGLI